MFRLLGQSVARRAWLWVGGWIVAAVVLSRVSPSAERIAAVEPPSLMPADQPYNVALQLEHEAFPNLASRTRTVLVFSRSPRLTAEDSTYLAALTARLNQAAAEGWSWRVQSPASHPFLRSRLLSPDGQAAMVIVQSDANYVTHRSCREVERIEALAVAGLPEGLAMAVTGEGGLGRDLAAASQEAYHRTTWVTVTALLFILAVVHRAPLAALVPLLSIAVSVYVAITVLNLLVLVGWDISATEKTFTVVLLFGSGVDFSLFWMSRHREELSRAGVPREAFVEALSATGPAITASAATTVCGFFMLLAAELGPSHNAGRALGLALIVALLAAVTLVPALSWLLGRALYWPRRSPPPADGSPAGGVWDAAARIISRRPGVVTVVLLAALAGPVWAGLNVDYHYDALGILPPESSAARGQEIARRHFGVSNLFSWTCLIELPSPPPEASAASAHARAVTDLCLRQDGVTDVWSLAHPLGVRSNEPAVAALAAGVGRDLAVPYYLSPDPGCLRFELMMDAPPFDLRAMSTCERVLDAVQRWAVTALGDEARVHGTGLTPYILNIRDVSQADQRRVMVLVVAAIALIVLAWVRDLPMAVGMLLATLVVYLATLGVADLFFARVAGEPGLDWKVKLFLFVVLVAVGQDYNIFVVSRIRQERGAHPPPEAVRRSIVRTGSVISGCGLIMAATLGSLAATGLSLLQELGFAFAFGVLLDAFVVRPLLVPACYLLTRRRRAA